LLASGAKQLRLLSAVLLFLTSSAHAQNPATAIESPAVHVIGTTPIPGLGTPVEEVPAPVRSLSALEVERSPG
jgi:iron complex outermembrane receptor protein